MARLVRILQNTHWIFVFVFFLNHYLYEGTVKYIFKKKMRWALSMTRILMIINFFTVTEFRGHLDRLI